MGCYDTVSSMRLLLPLLACFVTQPDRDAASDRDNDGYVAVELGGSDCDDSLSSVYPGAPESCLDAVDSDCDGANCPLRQERQSTLWASEILYANGALADFDGDGSAELVLSNPSKESDRGLVFRIELPLAQEADLRNQSVGTLRGDLDQQLWAWPIGDTDGDGDPELAISTRYGPGVTYVANGVPTEQGGTDRLPDRWLVDASEADGSGSDVTGTIFLYGVARSIGDVDGDGADETLLAAPTVETSAANGGAVYLLTGSPSGGQKAKDQALQVWEGEAASTYLGGFMGLSMDLDGDGVLEGLIGAPGWSPSGGGGKNQPGAVYGMPGTASGTEGATAAVFGRTANAKVSNANAVGDLNGDGHEELGVFLSSGSGQVLIFLGPVSGSYQPENADIKLLGDVGSDVTADFGGDLMGRVDVNQDGLGDLFVSASTEGVGTDGARGAGATYLYYGPLTGVQAPAHAAARWEGNLEDGNQRADLYADLDLDGVPDLFLLSPNDRFGSQSAEGSVRIDWDLASLDPR